MTQESFPCRPSLSERPSDQCPPSRHGARNVWFGDLQGVPPLPGQVQETLARYVFRQVATGEESREAFPSPMSADCLPRIVFLSSGDGTRPASVVMGAGRGIKTAVEQALVAIDQAAPDLDQRALVRWDIVQAVYPLPWIAPGAVLPVDPSLEGVAFDRASGIAFLAEEVRTHQLISGKNQLLPENIAAYLKGRFPGDVTKQVESDGGVSPSYRFTTASYFCEGGQIVPLYRGHRSFPQFTAEDLLTAARAGGAYLVRATRADGGFDYSYHPDTDSVPPQYNIVRHAGTLYSMLELYQVTRDEALLPAAERSLHYLLQQVRPWEVSGADAVVEDGFMKLGANALTILSLAKYVQVTGDRRHWSVMLRLGRWILAIQDPSGRFSVHKQSYPDGEKMEFESQYYPGEALLALLRLYALDEDDDWLDAAAWGALYLIAVRDRGRSDDQLPADHWLLYALNELHRLRPNPLYLEHALRIARTIARAQHRGSPFPDWLGGYYDPPRSTPTATRSEGLLAAYRLARDFHRPEDAKTFLQAARQGISFQLQTQLRPESTLYLKAPQRATGGFSKSLTEYEVRIDYVQHNISSLLGLYFNVGGEGKAGIAPPGGAFPAGAPAASADPLVAASVSLPG